MPTCQLPRQRWLLASAFSVWDGRSSSDLVGAQAPVTRCPKERSANLGSFAFQKMASKVCGPITDTQCGFKMFHSGVAKGLFSSTTPTGFAFDVAILAEARRRNHRMIELPVQWSDSPKSSFRPLIDGMHSFRQLRDVRRSFAQSHHPAEKGNE